MSTQRQSVAKSPTTPVLSRSEAARPPKPTVVERERNEAERNAYVSKLDQIKRQWFDTVAELKKVTWPDKETTKNLTLVVIGISVALGALLGGIDWILKQLFALF